MKTSRNLEKFDPIKVKIESINNKGKGIFKHNFFDNLDSRFDIPYFLPGEELLIKPKIVEKKLHTSLLEIIKESKERIKPKCKHFFKCGGCLLQHWNFNNYIYWKFNLISNPMKNILPNFQTSKLQLTKIRSRRRAKIFAKKTINKILIGFKEYKSNNIIDINECIVVHPDILSIIKKISVPLNKIMKINDEITFNVNKLDNGLDILIKIGETNTFEDFFHLNSWCISNKIVRLSLQKNNKEIELLGIFDSVSLHLEVGNVYMLPPPGGFFQATKLAEKIILQNIFSYIKNFQSLKILDLFSGSGTFSLPLLKNNHYVYSVDANELFINSLIKASKEQNLFNKLNTSIVNLMKNNLETQFIKSFDLVIVDPPRSGAKLAYNKLAEAKIPKIISISCNVDTFLSNCKILLKNDYKLISIIPIDQFLFTGHLETVAIFEL